MTSLILALIVAAEPTPPATTWGVSTRSKSWNDLESAAEVNAALNNGWRCSVSSASASYNARRTECRKNDERLEFTVQCDSAHARDHVQIRFSEGKSGDYIDVACHLIEQKP